MPVIFYAIEIVLCSVIWGWVAFKYRIMERVRENRHKASLLLSVLLAVTFVPTHYRALDLLILKLTLNFETTPLPAAYEPYISLFLSYKAALLIPVLIFAAFSLCMIFIRLSGRLRQPVVDFFGSLERFERLFLTVGSLIFAIVTVIVFNLTNVFYLPSAGDGSVVLFDVIYSTDTGATISRDCYTNPAAPENDLRQPLFGIFALPFGLSAKALSFLLPRAQTYPILINIVQIILLLISFILLSRMLEISRRSRIYFLLLTAVTFPSMLFTLNMEQYIFAFFWSILLIYHSYRTHRIGTVLPVAATGSILTSALLIPPLLFLNREWAIMEKGCKILLLFLALFICGGMIDVVHKSSHPITLYGNFIDNDSTNKWQQFTHFITSCFVAPSNRTVFGATHVSYQLSAIHSSSLVGMLLLGLSILSGFVFRRRFIAKISLYWVGFAFVLLFLFGWGTAENGLVLYSLYIFWSFAVLLMLLIDKLLPKKALLPHLVYGLLFLALLTYNVRQIVEIINFGITYYPVS
jgi:hypothetical protein